MLAFRVTSSVLLVGVLCGTALATPASPRARRGVSKPSTLSRARAFRVLTSDGASLKAKEQAAVSLGVGKLRQRVLTGVRRAQRGSFTGADDITEAIGRHGGPEALPALLGSISTRSRSNDPFGLRGTTDAIAALQIAERTGRLLEVEAKVLQVLARRVRRRPRDGVEARYAVNVLAGVRGQWALANDALPESNGGPTKPLNARPVQEFLFSLLDHPDAAVRESAARDFGGRGAPDLVLRALRGRGIRAERRQAVRKGLLEIAILVDDALIADERIYAEVSRIARGRDPVLRKAAKKIVAGTELDLARGDLRAAKTDAQIAKALERLERARAELR